MVLLEEKPILTSMLPRVIGDWVQGGCAGTITFVIMSSGRRSQKISWC